MKKHESRKLVFFLLAATFLVVLIFSLVLFQSMANKPSETTIDLSSETNSENKIDLKVQRIVDSYNAKKNRFPTADKMLPDEEMPAPEIALNGIDAGSKISNVDSGVKKGFWRNAPEALEKALSSQKKDPKWSRSIQESGIDFLDNVNLDGNSISNVDCRETLCKIEFFHTSIQALEAFKIKGISDEDAPWIGQKYGSITEIDHENDKAMSYMFFAPDGLPFGDLK